MNKRISRIMGVVVSLTLVASLFTFAVPVAAAPGDQAWFKDSFPTGSATSTSNVIKAGSETMGFAVADASTVYAIDSAGLAGQLIYKSTNAGQSFTNVTNTFTGIPVSIAVAPDNKDVVAVATATNVWTSSDAGTTWTNLNSAAPIVAPLAIQAIAIGPARSGTLLGREYFIAVSNTGAAALGDLMVVGGNSATFTTIAARTGTHDYLAVAVSPNYGGDRTVVALGATLAGLQVEYLTSPSGTGTGSLQLSSAIFAPLVTDVGGVGTGAMFGDIALPSNFDPSTTSGQVAFVTIASGTPGNDDVFRLNDITPRALGASMSPRSVAYAGTIDSGKLYVGQANGNNVKFSSDPLVSSPAWKSTDKAPVGATNVYLRLAADNATTNRVFAATLGQDSGLSISNDAAVSFTGESLLDIVTNNIGIVDAMEITPDGATAFVLSRIAGATLVPASPNDRYYLWKSVTPVSGSSWSLIFTSNANLAVAGSFLKVNPDYATTPALIFGQKGFTSLKVSQNGGTTFSNRTTDSNIDAIAMQDAQVFYMATGADVRKSTNAGFVWNSAVSTTLSGIIFDMIVPKADTILAGTNGAGFGFSTNGGASWTSRGTNLTGTNQVLAVDGDYANNALAYAGNGAGVVQRLKVGTSTAWENMNKPGIAPIIKMAFKNGALYAMGDDMQAVRVLDPISITAVAATDWSVLDQGAPATLGRAAAITGTANSNFIYAVDNAASPGIYSYSDFVAVKKPALTAPADNFALAVNPNTGTGDIATLRWDPINSGTVYVNSFDVEIVEKANGFTGTTFTTVPVTATGPFTLTTNTGIFGFLRPNVEYLWRVRSSGATNGETAKGPWSDGRTVKVQAGGVVNQPQAGIILQGPAAGAQNVNPTLVGFSWAPIQGATEYQIIVSSDAALTSPVGGTPAKVTSTSYQVTGLSANTTYFWAVKATLPTESQQSVGTFTTAAPPTTAAPQPTTQPTIIVTVPPAAAPETPAYIWAVIAIGAILVIAVIILIVRTRRVP